MQNDMEMILIIYFGQLYYFLDLLTSIRNTDMNKKGIVRIVSTNITENIVKILLRESFIESVRKPSQPRFFILFCYFA
jgi:ribosomal protein S8